MSPWRTASSRLRWRCGRPRVKRPEQVLAELDAVLAQGFSGCFLVDDNFIGNKVEAKRLLSRIIEWQEAHGFPLTFTTEASVNLADDRELIDVPEVRRAREAAHAG